MSDPTPQNINPALIPLDWNFYATDSSVVFKLTPTSLQPYWVEAHAHFGRFNSLPLSITLTSHQKGLEEGTALLERILKELLQRRLPNFFSQSGPPAGLELQPSIYYFGIHVQMDAIALDNPLIKHIPRRARAQVEKVLSIIPNEDLSDVIPSTPDNSTAHRPPSNPSADLTPPSEPTVTATAAKPAIPTEPTVPAAQPAAKSASQTATQKKAKAKRSAPSPTEVSQPNPAKIVQPDLISIATPTAATSTTPPQPTATAVITAPTSVVTGDAWDWEEEDDDDIIF